MKAPQNPDPISGIKGEYDPLPRRTFNHDSPHRIHVFFGVRCSFAEMYVKVAELAKRPIVRWLLSTCGHSKQHKRIRQIMHDRGDARAQLADIQQRTKQEAASSKTKFSCRNGRECFKHVPLDPILRPLAHQARERTQTRAGDARKPSGDLPFAAALRSFLNDPVISVMLCLLPSARKPRKGDGRNMPVPIRGQRHQRALTSTPHTAAVRHLQAAHVRKVCTIFPSVSAPTGPSRRTVTAM